MTVVEDLVSRKWLAHIVSSEETSTQIEIVFTDALEAEGLIEQVTAIQDGLARIDVDDEARPVLLAVSDNGPQMTSGSTREFMALCAVAQHFGRPGTPTDQAWIESFFGHLKVEHPHLLAIADPAVLRAELEVRREHCNGVRLSPPSATSPPTTSTKDEEHRSAKPDAKGCARHAPTASPTVDHTHQSGPDRGGEFHRPNVQKTQTHLTRGPSRTGAQAWLVFSLPYANDPPAPRRGEPADARLPV
ncbi:MAG: hypothetical protein ABR616_05290 [Dermatophilaceae bacterium]